jgi:hypothetical protein
LHNSTDANSAATHFMQVRTTGSLAQVSVVDSQLVPSPGKGERVRMEANIPPPNKRRGGGADRQRQVKVKVKVKQSCHRPEQAQRVDGGIALPFRDLGAKRGCVVSITPRLLYPQKRLSTHCIVRSERDDYCAETRFCLSV